MEFALILVYLRTIVVIVSVPLFKGVLVQVVVPVNSCFRDLKNNVDAAIKLFSNNNNIEEIIRPVFEAVKKEYVELTDEFLKHYPEAHVVDYLQSENDKRNFILAFRDIIKKHAEIQIYEDYAEDDEEFPMTEQQYMDFRSKYLDIHDTFFW